MDLPISGKLESWPAPGPAARLVPKPYVQRLTLNAQSGGWFLMYNPHNPLIVQSDRTALLEVDNPRYEECRDKLAAFVQR